MYLKNFIKQLKLNKMRKHLNFLKNKELFYRIYKINYS
jgi:hypothetical protein